MSRRVGRMSRGKNRGPFHFKEYTLMKGRGGNSDIVDIACTIIHQTDAAWLIDAGTDDDVWIPKSVGEYDETTRTMAMPESWAQRKGLI